MLAMVVKVGGEVLKFEGEIFFLRVPNVPTVLAAGLQLQDAIVT